MVEETVSRFAEPAPALLQVGEPPLVEAERPERSGPGTIRTVLLQDRTHDRQRGQDEEHRQQPFLLAQPRHQDDNHNGDRASPKQRAVASAEPGRQRLALGPPALVFRKWVHGGQADRVIVRGRHNTPASEKEWARCRPLFVIRSPRPKFLPAAWCCIRKKL